MRIPSRTCSSSLIFQTLLTLTLLLAINPSSHAQQQAPRKVPDRPESLRRIAQYEAAILHAQQTHSTDKNLPAIYLALGSTYVNVAMYPRAETAIRSAIALLQHGPESDLATATSDLAMLHLTTGDLRHAEKEELEALQLRKRVGEPIATAQSWDELAAIYLNQRQYKKAAEFAQKTMDAFSHVSNTDPRVDPMDRIRVRFTMARALCELHECDRAIPIMKDGIELAKATFGDDAMPVGLGYFLLGYCYWKNGEVDDAANWMQRGTTQMKPILGWGHPAYLDSLKQYAAFLREHGQRDAALAIDHEVRQAQSIVDVRSLTSAPGTGFASPQ